MANLLDKFKVAASRARADKSRTAAYAPAARALAVRYAHRELARGAAVPAIASRLGVTGVTLRTWIGDSDRPTGAVLRQVVVTKPNLSTRAVPAPSPAITITTSAGHVVTGLDLDSAASLLKALH